MKTVLVTGGTRGIGRACSVSFLEKGYNVIATYEKNDDAAQKFADECQSSQLTVMKCDMADFDDVANMFDNIKNKFGGVDILINNAGIAQQKMFCDVTRDDWDRMFDVNVGSMYMGNKRCFV